MQETFGCLHVHLRRKRLTEFREKNNFTIVVGLGMVLSDQRGTEEGTGQITSKGAGTGTEDRVKVFPVSVFGPVPSGVAS